MVVMCVSGASSVSSCSREVRKEGILKGNKRDVSTTDMPPSFCRVSSDEGSDEGSYSLSSSASEDSTPVEKDGAPASSSVGTLVSDRDSDSEHDDSSSSELSLQVSKGQPIDMDIPSTADPEKQLVLTSPSVSVETIYCAVPDAQRKRSKKRKRLNPGEMPLDDSLVHSMSIVKSLKSSSDEAGDAKSLRTSPLQKRCRTEKETLRTEPTDEKVVICGISRTPDPLRNIDSPSLEIDCSGKDEDGRNGEMKKDEVMYTPGSIVEVKGGIYDGRRGIVKKVLFSQVLVRISAFAHHVDRWLEPAQARALGDVEVLQLLNPAIPHRSDVVVARNTQTVAPEQILAPSPVDLDRIEPLPVNLYAYSHRAWAEDGSVDRDGFEAFVSDIFHRDIEENATGPDGRYIPVPDPLREQSVPGLRTSPNSADPVAPKHQMASNEPNPLQDVIDLSSSTGDAAASRDSEENEVSLFKTRMTSSSFDLQETLEVVTKVIDEVAGASRNPSNCSMDRDHARTAASESSNGGAETVDLNGEASHNRTQPEHACGREEGLQCEIDQNLEYVDSSIVEAFAPGYGYGAALENREKMARGQTAATALPIYDHEVETDCEELLADLDHHMPKGLFGDEEMFSGPDLLQPEILSVQEQPVEKRKSVFRKKQSQRKREHTARPVVCVDR